MPDEQRNQTRAAERELRLRACLADHGSFINDRLASFVGRADELAEIRRRIKEQFITGGYITITGQAGQGKSSVIAKLVDEYGRDNVAHHFIPFNPGPDHQVSLLRNLIACLALKHNLSEIYVASEQRAALRDYFATVLREVAEQGQQEILFLDGLDQLEEDITGIRDLSFLPNNPPVGIVFVLGTRPNDTLRPLELLKPHIEYQLPELSRQDFNLILGHHRVTLTHDQGDRFYLVMERNALYLDLVAKELHEVRTTNPETIIQRIADDPDNLFSFAIDRLRRQRDLWRPAIKPILGVLLVARETLSPRALRQLASADGDLVSRALERLGGLIVRDHKERYFLFHLKLRDFLHQDAQHTNQVSVFDLDEVEDLHQCLVKWCAGSPENLAVIWQPTLANTIEEERRAYARQHYIAHLSLSKSWDRLWFTLNSGDFGRSKLRHDPSTRSYVQDLDFARQSIIVASEGSYDLGVDLLPLLWRYSLLRCSLASQADNYTESMFETLVLLGREQEAVGLAELLTDQVRKVGVFIALGLKLAKLNGKENQTQQLLLRASVVAHTVVTTERAEVLGTVAQAFGHLGQGEEAVTIAHTIEDIRVRTRALSAIAQALGHLGQGEEAVTIANAIEDKRARARALSAVAQLLAQAGQGEKAAIIIGSIEISGERARALSAVAQTLAQAGQTVMAQVYFAEAISIASKIATTGERAQALSAVAQALARAGQMEQAITVTDVVTTSGERAWALSAVAQAFARAGQISIAQVYFAEAISIVHKTTIGELAQALSAVVQAVAQAGHNEEAMLMARAIEDTDARIRALIVVAQALAQAGHGEEAVTMARAIEDTDARIRALIVVAQALAQAEHTAIVQICFTEAINISRTINYAKQRADVLNVIAQAFAQLDKTTMARDCFEEAATIARTIPTTAEHVQILSEIALALAQAGQGEEAVTVARTVEDTRARARALGAVAQALAQAGQGEKAVVIARSIEITEERARALSAVAQVLAQAGQVEEAVTIARTIETIGERARAIGAVAQTLAQAGQGEEAATIARIIDDVDERRRAIFVVVQTIAEARKGEEALSIARAIEDKLERAGAIRVVAKGLSVAAKMLAQAGQVEEAVTIAHSIEMTAERAATLNAIAQTLAQAGQGEEAVTIARTIETIGERARTLHAVAQTLAQAGQIEEALTIARTIETTRKRARALSAVVQALAQTGHIEQAVTVAHTIENTSERTRTLHAVAHALVNRNDRQRLLKLVQQAWSQEMSREDLLQLASLAKHLIVSHPKIGLPLVQGLTWVNDMLHY